MEVRWCGAIDPAACYAGGQMEPELRDNPLLTITHPIPFDRVHAEHVVPAIKALLADARRELADLEQQQGPLTYEESLGRLEALTEAVERAMGVVGHLESVATTPELRAAYNEVQPEVSAFFSSISVSEGAYRVVKEFAKTPQAAQLDDVRARFLTKTLDSFRREGAELSPEGKARLSELDVELSEKTTKFAQNVLDATNAFELLVEDPERLAGLPERALEAARRNAESKGKTGYRFTLQAPSMLPLITHVADRELRETVYRAFNARASAAPYDNGPIVRRILELRQQKAELLGFQNFVDLVLADRMAKDGRTARDFIGGLRSQSEPAFADENTALSAFQGKQDAAAGALEPWDVNFYAERQRKALFDFDEEALRPYFSLERVLAGMFELVQKLYGIRVEDATGVPVWHESVRTYRMVDGDESELGIFYADLFPREQKRDGAWMNAFFTGLPAEAGWTPHVGLICANLTPPLAERPALLSHREVETVFHEFGHLLHHMLSRVPVRSLAGTSVAWDFVELPSQIMENFCWERASLDLFARHYQSGERIPDDLFERMSRARTYRAANHMMRQLGFASLDLALHMDYAVAHAGGQTDRDVVDFAREVMAPFAPVAPTADYAMVLGFGHLFGHPVGYAGGYYSYKWAEVLDADAFSRFRAEGLFSATLGREFREKILARGDSQDPMALFVDFMGRGPEQRALLERSGIDVTEAA